ncbi:MAG TPA: DUF6174 domain-containing protein [Gemmatimonadaceae bacterium]|nr:DUF6174 domain-containing protein [Gemmatimonadaceae bacterium]
MLIACFACGGAGALLSPHERAELSRAELRWNARTFANYSYEIQQSCFCPTEMNAWTRVIIQGGAVASAVNVETGAQVSSELYHLWFPVDSLFARLHAATKQPSEAYADIIVTFDSALGFPTYIEWKEKPNVADAGAVYRLRNLAPQD